MCCAAPEARAHSSGLGLANVRDRFTKFGGETLVESEVGVGSAAALRLPSVALGANPELERAQIAHGGGRKVRVVEANQRVRAAEDFGQLLTPVKSAEAAWLLSQVKLGASPYLCGSEEFAAQRAVDAGFELRERRFTKRCGSMEKTEFVYRVTSSGDAEVVSQKVHAPGRRRRCCCCCCSRANCAWSLAKCVSRVRRAARPVARITERLAPR